MSIIVITLAALFGLCIGSFLNVCIHRLPREESVVHPGSHCGACGAPVKWYDNLPVISYLVLGGKCRACRASYSARYLWVEVLTAVIFAITAAVTPPDALHILLGSRLVFAALLIALFFIDLEHQLLPDVLTLPGIAIGLLASLFVPPGIVASVIGAAVGAGVLQAIRLAWKRATGQHGMGFGDVKMLAMIGAFLGWEQVWFVLFAASLTGAAVGVAITLGGRGSMKTRLPFGTFLAVAALVAAWWGDPVVAWYVGLITLQ